MTKNLEITGPVAAKLWVSSETTDADLFLALRVFDPAGKEVTFIGSNDPRTPVGLGWLRASHRKLDPKLSKPYRPWHTHDEERRSSRASRSSSMSRSGRPDRGAAGLPPRAHGARQGLRVRRPRYRFAECSVSDEGRGPVPACRPGRPAARDLRLPEYAALRLRTAALSLLPIIPRRKL